jgi:hypothetical protein
MVQCCGEQVLGPIHELDKTCSYIIFELGKSLKKLYHAHFQLSKHYF